jgi:hypothetical protein
MGRYWATIMAQNKLSSKNAKEGINRLFKIKIFKKLMKKKEVIDWENLLIIK